MPGPEAGSALIIRFAIRSLGAGLLAWRLVLAALPARAQPADRPFVVPQRDVDVTYAMPAPAGTGAATQRMRFSAGLAKQRVDPPGAGTYMITDYGRASMVVVQPGQRLATELPAPGQPIAPHGVRATGEYRRLGARNLAGQACTDWATRDVAGNESVVCLTDDGVMLEASQGGHVLVQAVRVTYGDQPPALFAVPDGFRLQPVDRER